MSIDILKKIRQDESGATAIEYALIAALVFVVAVGALISMGGSQNTISQTLSNLLAAAADSGPGNNDASALGGGKAAGGKGKGGKGKGDKGKGDKGKGGKGKGGKDKGGKGKGGGKKS